jgi:ketosteroid isomerase-like protein
MIESFNPSFTDHSIELQDIQGYGDVAYARGNYTETFSVSGAPEPITDVAKLMFGFRKQPDGSWLVATEMWSTDLS